MKSASLAAVACAVLGLASLRLVADEAGPGQGERKAQGPVPCTFANPQYAGKCTQSVTPAAKQTEVEACQVILGCLNDVRCVKTYCNSTTIRGGWSLVSPKPKDEGGATDAEPARMATSYHFRENTLIGTVWVSGANARREIESGGGGTGARRVEIWRDGGKTIDVLDPGARTYYEERAFLARQGLPRVSLEALTLRGPFRIDGVENVRVALTQLPMLETISGVECHRALLRFSYDLKVSAPAVGDSLRARVEGSEDFCFISAVPSNPLPFGHGLDLTSGHPQVDAAIAAQVAALNAIPVARIVKVTRQIDGGDVVAGTSTLLLSDIREVPIASDAFTVPSGYRLREPRITPPVRKRR